ncbi:MAG: hypothetical protein GF347_01320 [Candidatus Moranbacteria bacterium]|nr:hypothetical protein [Candidatus Moranbacteria bacterium]
MEYTLSDGGGEKTVYVKYKDSAGNESTSYSTTFSVTVSETSDSTTTTTSTININGTLYRSTHTQKTKHAFQKEDQRKICVYTKGGTKKDCDRSDDKAKFTLEGLDEGGTYILYSSSKKKVSKRYFYERMYLYKKKYEKTFGKDWIKKFKSKYRIKKKKDNNYKTDLTYYRKYKAKRKITADSAKKYRVYMK